MSAASDDQAGGRRPQLLPARHVSGSCADREPEQTVTDIPAMRKTTERGAEQIAQLKPNFRYEQSKRAGEHCREAR